MVKVKICGITNLEDALMASRAGGDMLGFNFYSGSPRYLEPNVARRIADQVPHAVKKVGVFVNESIENILETVAVARLDTIQLHGVESAEFLTILKSKTGLKVIKAFRIPDSFEISTIADFGVETILLDSSSPSEFGGTGKTFDWQIARMISNDYETVLAGGLGPDNVAEAINAVRPFAVDACSRLESYPGKKDTTLVEEFVRNARAAI